MYASPLHLIRHTAVGTELVAAGPELVDFIHRRWRTRSVDRYTWFLPLWLIHQVDILSLFDHITVHPNPSY